MRITLLATVLLLVAGCRSGMPPKTAPAPTPGARQPCATSAAHAPRSMIYRFAVGDEMAIDVWQETDLSSTQRVLPDGTVSPALVGSVHIAGRTVDEAKEMFTRLYREYLKEPVVSVRVTNIYSDRVFVLGEVDSPQAVSLTGPISLVQAISEAGGFLEEYADKSKVRIVRTGPDGQPIVHVVNVDAVLAARAADMPMQRGDVVWVPARGVSNWNRNMGQALAPFAVALGAAGSTAAIITSTSR